VVAVSVDDVAGAVGKGSVVLDVGDLADVVDVVLLPVGAAVGDVQAFVVVGGVEVEDANAGPAVTASAVPSTSAATATRPAVLSAPEPKLRSLGSLDGT
jgi:hypothetical protein